VLIKLEKDMEAVGTTADGAGAVDIMMQKKPKIFLMDLKIPVQTV
jgi:YesN/AraC family two-component response regulator